jgi:hypothetical protein
MRTLAIAIPERPAKSETATLPFSWLQSPEKQPFPISVVQDSQQPYL